MFTLRFDMRAPSWAGPVADLYGAAVDMCAWAETRNEVLAISSEHHVPTTAICATADGPLPLHPLCGGVPPEVAWPYLQFAAAAVQR